MSALIKAMKAILGCTPVRWPEPDDLTVGGMLLKDLRIAFCLCRAKELRHADWSLKNYGPTITVQCGSGWWAASYKPCAPNLHFDLSTWTFYAGKGKGSMLSSSSTSRAQGQLLQAPNQSVRGLMAAGSSEDPNHTQYVGIILRSWPASALCTPNRILDVEISHP